MTQPCGVAEYGGPGSDPKLQLMGAICQLRDSTLPAQGRDAVQARKYLPALDGMRALSVLAVITVHMHQQVWNGANGILGVIVFFALSGYLISSLALAEEKQTGRLDLPAFYILRAFRILPLYYIVLGAYCVVIFGFPLGHSYASAMRRALPYYLTYMQDVPYTLVNGQTSVPLYQTWSLGVEEKFYLLWPLLAFVLAPKFRAAIGITLFLLCAGFAFRHSAVGDMVTMSSAIPAGCVVAIAAARFSFNKLRLLWIPLTITLLTFHMLVMPRHPSTVLFVAYAALTSVLIGVLADSRTLLHQVLESKPLVWVGRVSYGIYLIHMLCVRVAERISSNALGAYVITCLLSVAVASFLYLVIERPLIGLGRRIAHARASLRVPLSVVSA